VPFSYNLAILQGEAIRLGEGPAAIQHQPLRGVRSLTISLPSAMSTTTHHHLFDFP
jgi:hypothetical protein